MLTPPEDVPFYTSDFFRHSPDFAKVPGDLPLVPADLFNRLRTKVEAAEKLAYEVSRHLEDDRLDNSISLFETLTTYKEAGK